jgi:hypothetical protein
MEHKRPQRFGGSLEKHTEQIVAYLSYALKDVRGLSPLGAHLLEMSIAVLNDDIRSANETNDNDKDAKAAS